jgi:hypothetical protein
MVVVSVLRRGPGSVQSGDAESGKYIIK